MSSDTRSLLDLADAEGVSALLGAVVASPQAAARAADEIHGLDPLVDAPRLARLRTDVRAALGSSGEEPSDAVRAAARLLLDRLAARQTPVGAALHDLLENSTERFTPALLRAAVRTRDRPRTRRDLAGVVDEQGLRFLSEDLVRAGALTRTAGHDGDQMAAAYRLMPAGLSALRPIARRVLELELGRFPWPEGIPDPASWASRTRRDLYEFRHGGRDGEAVARCVGAPPDKVGSVSVPSLYGLARETEAQGAGAVQTLAVFYGPGERWTRTEVEARTKRILDDHLVLFELTDQRVDHLTLFAAHDLVSEFGGNVEEACREAHVACGFAE